MWHVILLVDGHKALELTSYLGQEGMRMRCAEAYPQSWIKAKIMICGGADETKDPGVSKDVTFINIKDLNFKQDRFMVAVYYHSNNTYH